MASHKVPDTALPSIPRHCGALWYALTLGHFGVSQDRLPLSPLLDDLLRDHQLWEEKEEKEKGVLFPFLFLTFP